MADINSFSKVEPEYVKEVIPISFYALDDCWIDPKQEFGNFLLPAEHAEESEFVKMVIPISAFEQDDHFLYKEFEPGSLMSMVGNLIATRISKPGQPGAIM